VVLVLLPLVLLWAPVSDALFEVGEARPARAGKTEAALVRAIKAGQDDGTIRDVDEALAESALVLARALDTADRVGGLKGGYLAAQAQPPLQKALHALRLPAELTAVPPPLPAPDGQQELPNFLRDLGDALGPA
jgi:hypothetical protein